MAEVSKINGYDLKDKKARAYGKITLENNTDIVSEGTIQIVRKGEIKILAIAGVKFQNTLTKGVTITLNTIESADFLNTSSTNFRGCLVSGNGEVQVTITKENTITIVPLVNDIPAGVGMTGSVAFI